ncbi:PorT family protein [Aureispira anguillae]|uniref:PorT family protein n=1 Tax=Aureispira anguillae TaxID=2864201 RepID=A0A915YDK0_9BACT|nr:PorT family protein [Aureispira anguillae]BDS11129.1 PorT family protein [Aureispira anguillae]
MQLLTLLFSLLLLASSATAQQGLEWTASLSPNFSFILNNDDLSDSSEDARPSLGSYANFTIGHNFTPTVGLGTGLGFVYIRQNYIKRKTANQIKALQHKVYRELSYIRLPLLVRISSNPSNKFSFFMRAGLHLDILLTASSTHQHPPLSGLPNQTINYRTKYNKKEEPLDIFRSFVLGFSLELGTKIKFTDQIGLLLLGHFETSFTNTEGSAALAYFPASLQSIHAKGFSLIRAQSWNLMLGISIGIIYHPYRAGRTYQKKRKYRTHYWS